jgi:hypothetical protein
MIQDRFGRLEVDFPMLGEASSFGAAGKGCCQSSSARCAALLAAIVKVSDTLSGTSARALKSTFPIASPTQE